MGISVLTGSSGFVGSHIASKLLQEDWEVRALLRASSSVSGLSGDCTPIRVDFLNHASIAEAIHGAELIIHSAGAVKAASQEEFDRANGLVTRNILRARESSCPTARFIYISSQAAVGPTGSCGPVTAYGRSKLLGEIAVRETGNWVIVRPPAVFGPGDRASAPMFIRASKGILVSPWTRGAFSMVYVEDLARLTVMLGNADGVEGAVLEPSYGRLFTWRDLHRSLEEAAGRRILHMRIPPVLIVSAAFISEIASTITGGCPLFTRDKCRELLADSWEIGECDHPSLAGWRSGLTLVEALRETLSGT